MPHAAGPLHPRAVVHAASCLRRRGRHAAAQQIPISSLGVEAIKARTGTRRSTHLTPTRRIEPANADAQNLLGYAYATSSSYDLAFKHYGEALRLDPQHRGAHEYIGEAYVLVGDKAKAQEHLAALERICGKGCDEYQDLAKAIAQAK